MARAEKAGNPKVKAHRAGRIAERMMREGATRAAANRTAGAAMDREYGVRGGPRQDGAGGARDSRTGRPKTGWTTKNPAESGARKPSAAARATSSSKNQVKKTGGGGKAAAGRKPRPASGKAAAATRPPIPRTAKK